MNKVDSLSLALSREGRGDKAKTLGVLGGGQLGRMFVQAAQAMGLRVIVLDPEAQKDGALSPAAQIADGFMNAPFTDVAALQSLAEQCCAITTEFENVPADALEFLAQPTAGVRVSPPASAVRIAQDRIAEKRHFTSCGVPIAPYYVMDDEAQLAAVPSDFYPAILKSARMGYDGKGQLTVYAKEELHAAWERLGRVVCVLEKRVPLAFECSVLLARQMAVDGVETIAHWPVQRNVHTSGILATTAVAGPADARAAGDQALHESLIGAAKNIAAGLDYIGVLCIEFFILSDGSWVVNEMAPRPHNSGHVTMNASSLSQFEAQVRVAAGLPLVQPRQHSSCVMINLLGEMCVKPDWAKVLALGGDRVGIHLHLYGKEEVRQGRKMGHINITANSLEGAWQTATLIQQQLLG